MALADHPLFPLSALAIHGPFSGAALCCLALSSFRGARFRTVHFFVLPRFYRLASLCVHLFTAPHPSLGLLDYLFFAFSKAPWDFSLLHLVIPRIISDRSIVLACPACPEQVRNCVCNPSALGFPRVVPVAPALVSAFVFILLCCLRAARLTTAHSAGLPAGATCRPCLSNRLCSHLGTLLRVHSLPFTRRLFHLLLLFPSFFLVARLAALLWDSPGSSCFPYFSSVRGYPLASILTGRRRRALAGPCSLTLLLTFGPRGWPCLCFSA